MVMVLKGERLHAMHLMLTDGCIPNLLILVFVIPLFDPEIRSGVIMVIAQVVMYGGPSRGKVYVVFVILRMFTILFLFYELHKISLTFCF